MKNSFFLLIVILIIFNVYLADSTKIIPEDYIVKTGDKFILQTSLSDSLLINITVLPSGGISLHPFADSVMVAGLKLNEVYNNVYKKLGCDENNRTYTFQLFSVAPIRYNILGEVVHSGEYISEGLTSLQQVISKAGGLSSSASKKIQITRDGKNFECDLVDYYLNNNISANPYIMQDDVILVKTAENAVKVYVNFGLKQGNSIQAVELNNRVKTINDIIPLLLDKNQETEYKYFTLERDGMSRTVDINEPLQANDKLYLFAEEVYVYVIGFVNNPGYVMYNGSFNAQYYVTLCGGHHAKGSKSKIQLQDKDGVFKAYKGENIKPGDTIYIPESFRSKTVEWLIPISTVVSIASTTISVILILNRR